MTGFTEVLTFILCSSKENFAMLNRKDDKSVAVIIGNPRSSDFEVCIRYISILKLVDFEVKIYFTLICNFIPCLANRALSTAPNLSLSTSYLHINTHCLFSSSLTFTKLITLIFPCRCLTMIFFMLQFLHGFTFYILLINLLICYPILTGCSN